MKRSALVVVAALVASGATAVLAPAASGTPSAGSCGTPVLTLPTTLTVTCPATGAPYSWTFPTGVTKATFTAYGAQGGSTGGGKGGLGGSAAAQLSAPAGGTVLLIVGKAGSYGPAPVPGGFGGGGTGGNQSYPSGSGGGGSFVQDGSGHDLLVAGGGGGGVALACGTPPGSPPDADGGSGGGLVGASGAPCYPPGGQPGSGGSGTGSGGIGQGGNGSGPSSGGGGGGGYVGGGGGYNFAAGGGGSGYGPNGKTTFNSGVQPGDGLVTISWDRGKATPTIGYAPTSPITYGTALGAGQLDATATDPDTAATVAGTFAYSTGGNAVSSGDVLDAGTYNVKAAFTPSNTAAYKNANATASLEVDPDTPTVTVPSAQTVVYPAGPTLDATVTNSVNSSLSPKGTVAWTFTGTLSDGTAVPSTAYTGQQLQAGSYTFTATFTPGKNYKDDYNTATGSTSVTVSKATPTVTYNPTSPITYPATLGAAQLDATSGTAGTFGYSASGTTSGGAAYGPQPVTTGSLVPAGSYTVTATLTPTDSVDYASGAASAPLVVDKGTPAITWAAPTAITYGTALGATQLDASASVAGTFTYSPAAGTVLHAGQHTLSAMFTPSDTADYATVTTTTQLVVNQAPLTITAQDASRVYGAPDPAFGVGYAGFVNGDGPGQLTGTLVITSGATTTSDPGTYALTPSGLASADYVITYVPGTLTINQASVDVALSVPASTTVNTPLSVSATVTAAAPSTGAPTGSVSFYLDGSTIAAATVALVGGTASWSTTFGTGGLHSIKAVYNGSTDFLTGSQSATVAVDSPPQFTGGTALILYAARKNSSNPIPTTGAYPTPVRFTDFGAPTWLQFDPATGAFSGTPTIAQAGSYYVLVEACNADGTLCSYLPVMIHVLIPNAPVPAKLPASSGPLTGVPSATAKAACVSWYGEGFATSAPVTFLAYPAGGGAPVRIATVTAYSDGSASYDGCLRSSLTGVVTIVAEGYQRSGTVRHLEAATTIG